MQEFTLWILDMFSVMDQQTSEVECKVVVMFLATDKTPP